jgi:hypothetical protein
MRQTDHMLVTNHVLSGALLGAAVRSPWLAFPLGVASHFVLDAAPHWGKWDDDTQFMRVAVTDGLVGLAAMGAATAVVRPEQRVSVLAGMVGAALPDLNKPTHVFFGFSPFPAKVDAFHARIQDEAPHRFRSHELVAGAVCAAGIAAFALWPGLGRRPHGRRARRG